MDAGLRRGAGADRVRQGRRGQQPTSEKAAEAAGDKTLATGLGDNAKFAAAIKAAGLDGDARRADALHRAGARATRRSTSCRPARSTR